MRHPCNRISASLPAAHESGFRLSIHRYDPLARERESRCPSLGGCVRCESEKRSSTAAHAFDLGAAGEQLAREGRMILARVALADAVFHEARQAGQPGDGRINPTLKQVTIQHDLPFGDVASQIGHRLPAVKTTRCKRAKRPISSASARRPRGGSKARTARRTSWGSIPARFTRA